MGIQTEYEEGSCTIEDDGSSLCMLDNLDMSELKTCREL